MNSSLIFDFHSNCRCDTCDSFKNLPLERKEEEKDWLETHHADEKMTRHLMNKNKKDAKENPQICAANYDLKKTLTSPKQKFPFVPFFLFVIISSLFLLCYYICAN